jgi:hypothetical protein
MKKISLFSFSNAKIVRIGWILSIAILSCVEFSYAQVAECTLEYSPPQSKLTEDFYGDCLVADCGQQGDNLPLVTFNYNFHFIAGVAGNLDPDDPTTTADDFLLTNAHRTSELILEAANNLLEDFQLDNLSSNSFIGDSRMRANLYTEANNSDDIHGGIWFWNSLTEYNQAMSSNANLYQNQVKNVVFRDATHASCPGSRLEASTGLSLNNTITAFNYQLVVIDDCWNTWPPLRMGRTLVHETFHNLGLNHSFVCVASGNPCGAVDLDLEAECGNGGDADLTNDCNPSTFNEGICDNSGSGSNNNMGQNPLANAISCCQWGLVYKRAVTAKPNWADIEQTQSSNIVVNAGQDLNWLGFYEADNIVIKNGGKLTVSGQLKVGNRITIEPGGELYLDCALVTNRNAEKWEGIIVEGNSNAHQFELNGIRQQGFLRVNNSTLENASFAIRTYGPDQDNPNFLDERGGVVVASDSDFKNNQQSVSIVDYQGYNPFTNQPYRNLSAFTNCTFTIDNDYIGAYKEEFRNHVYLRQVTGIPFNGCDFINEVAGLDYAHKRRIGIESRDANFIVGAACLDDGLGSDPCSNPKNSVFRGMGYGISAFNTASANTFRVVRTDFEDNFVGIHANSVNNIYAVRNNFQIGNNLPPEYADTYYTGIQLFNATGYQVEDNDFFPSGLIEASQVTVGSAVSGSWREANEIYRNRYSGLMYGNLSNGDNRSNTFANIGLGYICNDNTQNSYDFGVDEESDIAEDQGSANLSAGNCFSNNPVVIESDFRNEAASINYFFETNCNPLDVSFSVNKFLGEINQCPSRIPGDERGKLSASEKQNLQQGFGQSSDIAFQTHSANKLIRDYLIDEENYDWAAARTWLNNKGSLESHFMIIDSWLYEGNTNQAKQALDNINYLNEEKEEYKAFSKLKEIQMQAIDEGISVENMVESNLTQISEIANGNGGNLVFEADGGTDLYAARQAQGLVNSFQENTYIPTLLLPDGNIQQSLAPNISGFDNTTIETLPLLQAAPNPSKDVTVFTYQLPDDLEKATIEVRNIQGQIVKVIQVNENTGKILWNVGELANGVYLYSLVVEEKNVLNQRLIITK